MHTYTTVLLSLYSKQWANPVCLLKISAILKRLMTRIIQMWDTKHLTENGQSRSTLHYGPSLRGKGDDWHIWYPKYCIQLDIFFGVWTTVYKYVLIISKPTFFLVPFYNAGVAEFLSTVPWSDQIGTSDDYKIHLQV